MLIQHLFCLPPFYFGFLKIFCRLKNQDQFERSSNMGLKLSSSLPVFWKTNFAWV